MPVTCTNYKLKCGGCPLLNQPYPDQLKHKQQLSLIHIFHANDLLCPARRAQADGANAAVGIDHCFFCLLYTSRCV